MAIAHTRTWDETEPAGGTIANTLDTVIQNDLVDVRERMQVEHEWNNSVSEDGRHKEGSARALVDVIANIPADRSGTPLEGAGGNEEGRIFIASDVGVGEIWAAIGTAWVNLMNMDHRSRHLDVTTATGVEGDDYDYLEYLPKLVQMQTASGPTTVTTAGLNNQTPITIDMSGRRTATSRVLQICKASISIGSGSSRAYMWCQLDAASVADSLSTMFIDIADDYGTLFCVYLHTGLSVASHTFQVEFDAVSSSFDYSALVNVVIDLGVAAA